MSHPLRKAGVLLAASAMTAGALASPASAAPARAATDDSASRLAASWLEDELTNGLVVGQYGADYGLTIDTGLALSETGDKAAVKAISGALEPKVGDYVGTGSESYAGPTAKAAVFARAAGANPTSYGGRNLLTDLEALVADSGATAGRIADKSTYGDYANVLGQSFAVRALSTGGSKEDTAARDYLLKQQCTSGFFRLYFSKPGDAQQGCVEGAAGSEADPDATAMAIINLVNSHEKAKPVKDAVDRAATWLAAQQRRSGAFRGGASTRKLNTNSTALAGHALGLTGRTDAAKLAATWVRRQQPVDKAKCRSALSKELGAVAYRGSSVAAARTGGITKDARDEWRRATAQAALVLRWAPASADRLAVQPVRRTFRPGGKARFRIVGLAPGERACIQVKGAFKRVMGKKSGAAIVRQLRMPTGNRGRAVIVKTADERVRAWARVRR